MTACPSDLRQMAEAGRRIKASMDAMAEAMRRSAEALFGLWELVVEDPYMRRPTTIGGVLQQMRDIVLHDFWIAAERPGRAPGATYRRRKA